MSTLIAVQGGAYPTNPAGIERHYNGDQGIDPDELGIVECAVGDVIDAARLDPRIAASLVANRIAVPAEDAPAVSAALVAQYGETRTDPRTGATVGITPLDAEAVAAALAKAAARKAGGGKPKADAPKAPTPHAPAAAPPAPAAKTAKD